MEHPAIGCSQQLQTLVSKGEEHCRWWVVHFECNNNNKNHLQMANDEMVRLQSLPDDFNGCSTAVGGNFGGV